VSLPKKLNALNRAELLAFGFFAVTGLLLLAFLPVTGFPPHIGFLGVASLIAAYSIFTKRFWTPWLVFLLFAVISVFSIYTIYSVGSSDLLISLIMIAYVALNWFCSLNLLKRGSTP
jgi:hypothetical protein